MVARTRRWEGRLMVRTLLLAVGLTGASALPAADAADQVISAVAAPTLGVGIDAQGHVVSGGTMAAHVEREWRGRTLIITVVPN
ncbi:MAG: hypothetical protein JWM71_300 [Solirubrobacteraceae bacterium]|nr:hypothetical protein [Solirubrobacteraceae bacterium]